MMLPTKTIARSTNGIHSGEKTHHQDQSMFPVNLRTTKPIVRTPVETRPGLVKATLVIVTSAIDGVAFYYYWVVTLIYARNITPAAHLVTCGARTPPKEKRILTLDPCQLLLAWSS